MRAQVIKWLHTDCIHSVQLPAKALHFSHNIHNDPGPYSASMDFCWIVRRQSESETPIYLCSSQVNDLWSFTLCRVYVDDMVLSQDNLSFIWHSEDRASWYILTIKANKMHNFSTCFGQVHCPSSGVSQHCIHAIGIVMLVLLASASMVLIMLADSRQN